MNLLNLPRIRAACLLLVLALVLLAPAAMMAQSCALCYTQAASSTQKFIQALRSGIIILMVPPAFMCVGITVVSYRRRNSFHQSGNISMDAIDE